MNWKLPKVTRLGQSKLIVSEGAARVCYDSFNMSENEELKDWPVIDEDILSSELLNKLSWAYQHESILEHTTVSYFIQDLSREVLQELARHRVGMAISVKSTRYTIEDLVNAYVDFKSAVDNSKNQLDDPYVAEMSGKLFTVIGNNVIGTDDEWIHAEGVGIVSKLDLFDNDEKLVKGLSGSKKKKQNDRVKRCLPESWTTELVLTFNLRALKHFFSLRMSGAAYYGIQELAKAIKEQTPENYLEYVLKEK